MLHHTSHLLYTELTLKLNFIHFIFKYLHNLSPISITDIHTPYGLPTPHDRASQII